MFGDGDTCDEGHRAGDRHDHISGLQEWDGQVWAPVCPTCDIPMGARDGAGHLCCGRCGRRVTDVGRPT